MKKHLCLALTILLAISLNGCGGKASKTSSTNTTYKPGASKGLTVGSSPSAVSFNIIYVPGGLTFPTKSDDSVSDNSVTAAYWIAQTETTYELWAAVYTWATSGDRGTAVYSFVNPGQQGGVSAAGSVGTNQHPVTRINWYDAVVWCNALTEYYNATQTGASLTCAYNSGGIPIRDASSTVTLDNVTADSFATGFRLPTSMEWELAARYIKDRNGDGDICDKDQGYEYYPGAYASGADADVDAASASSDIDGDGDLQLPNDVGVHNGTGTAVVMSRGASSKNALGLYDMSGNVMEWCFDWCPIATYSDYRVVRGGSWFIAYNLKIGALSISKPISLGNAHGFRIARTHSDL